VAGQAARILEAMARASSHICAGSVSVATSHKSIAALWRIATMRLWAGSLAATTLRWASAKAFAAPGL